VVTALALKVAADGIPVIAPLAASASPRGSAPLAMAQ
jgi:hypothetical protein